MDDPVTMSMTLRSSTGGPTRTRLEEHKEEDNNDIVDNGQVHDFRVSQELFLEEKVPEVHALTEVPRTKFKSGEEIELHDDSHSAQEKPNLPFALDNMAGRKDLVHDVEELVIHSDKDCDEERAQVPDNV